MHAQLVANSRFFSPVFIPAFIPEFAGLLAEAALTADEQPESTPNIADARQGCGWFDSTYELQQGLTVTEDIEFTVFRRCEAEASAAWALIAAQAAPASE